MLPAGFHAAGVYVGCMYQEYLDVQVSANPKVAPQAVVGSGLSFMVGRLSYTFNFSGPCVSTDTACSSSLVSTHLACKVSKQDEPHPNNMEKQLKLHLTFACCFATITCTPSMMYSKEHNPGSTLTCTHSRSFIYNCSGSWLTHLLYRASSLERMSQPWQQASISCC